MKNKEFIKRAKKLANPFRINDGKEFKLKHFDPSDILELKSEDIPLAQVSLQIGIELLSELQDKLYAQDRWSVLLIFQAMDAAG
ncbi:MAG: polyphosphate kinase 2 family protein, partial [Ignavibacteriales bacterium]